MENTNYLIEGRKTFFITPDATLLPEFYLQDYFAHGYESYIINDDRYCPLDKKIESLISIFPDSIFFFYIDSEVEGISWPTYIRDLQEKYSNKILIGVLYQKRHKEVEKNRLEKFYLFDIGIQGGCISLEYQKAKNFVLIDKVMFANQACGRRKNIRAICDDSSKISFYHKGFLYKGRLSDISLTHFSCTLQNDFDIPLYEKVHGAYIDLNGLHFKTDAILLMDRVINNTKIYVFVFTKTDGFQGLELDVKGRLSEKIYKLVTDKVKTIMQMVFDEIGKNYREHTHHTTFAPKDLFRQE